MTEATVAAPDLIEPILGWRCWRISRVSARSPIRLASIHHDVLWPVRKRLEAVCERPPLQSRPAAFGTGDHPVPGDNCTCGIYAASTVDGALPYLVDANPRMQLGGRGSVLGLVYLWGTVMQCARGWRASYAYPRRLFVVVSSEDEVVPEATVDLTAYGAPVELLVATESAVSAELEARGLPLELLPGKRAA